MAFIQNKYNNIFLAFLCIFLFIVIFYWIHFLTINQYIVECFTPGPIQEDTNTSNSVDLPLTTKYSCKNFCGPNSRCSITGQQCMADIDCPGCQPYIPPVSLKKPTIVPGDDDAGKLTWGVTPQYSSLTNGYGTKERIVTDDLYSKPAQANFGINTWRSSYDAGEKLFDQRYRPSKSNLQFVPNYPNSYSLTGEFTTEGPLPSNAYL
jgi:hypothetical protein